MLRMLGAFLCCAVAASAAASDAAASPEKANASVQELIPWLLDENRQLSGIAFSEVILATTGKRVLSFDLQSESDQRLIKQISGALDEVTARMNAPESPVQQVGRINEVSSHVENLLRERLSAIAGLRCDFPRTSEGRVQRSGYPDLRIVDEPTQRVLYLDPKLYAAGSRESSFRTFYFEPKIATNKVTDDAVHLIVGFEHAPKNGGRWNFTRWDLVDLAHFKVRLKAEFQGSNRDIYRPGAVVATSAK
jgi:hypothetical protein